MKRIILSLWLIISIALIASIGFEYFQYYLERNAIEQTIKINVETPIAKIDIDADNDVEWQLVGKLLVLVLVTYGGIKFINKKLS